MYIEGRFKENERSLPEHQRNRQGDRHRFAQEGGRAA
jgi:hypothetical protein